MAAIAIECLVSAEDSIDKELLSVFSLYQYLGFMLSLRLKC